MNTFIKAKMDPFLEILSQIAPISLKEMNSVQLMNRMDTKYLTNFETLHQLLNYLKEYYFIQFHNESTVAQYQTVYYDTQNLLFFTQHQNGKLTRNKVRIRRYCDSNQFFCEIKRKNNTGRTKKRRIEVASNDFLFAQQNKDIQKLILLETEMESALLIPTLENNFQRITLVNKEKTERLTIDFDIHFYNHITKIKRSFSDLVIIELKQEGRGESILKKALHLFPIYQKSFSKYCIGTVITNPNVKYNRFKSKVRYIEKTLHTTIKDY